jgi:hypothetical protein
MILIAIYVAEVAAVLGSLGTARTGGALFRSAGHKVNH